MNPETLKYTNEHEWVHLAEDGATAVVGITEFAAQALGDVVYVDLPEAGTALEAGETIGEIESTKSVSDLYAPLSGEVTERNESVVDAPETVNEDPMGSGWLFKAKVADLPEDLLDYEAYQGIIG